MRKAKVPELAGVGERVQARLTNFPIGHLESAECSRRYDAKSFAFEISEILDVCTIAPRKDDGAKFVMCVAAVINLQSEQSRHAEKVFQPNILARIGQYKIDLIVLHCSTQRDQSVWLNGECHALDLVG